MRYVKDGRVMRVLMWPESKEEACVSAKWIDDQTWETESGREFPTDEEKREVLRAAVQECQRWGRKVTILDPQPWQRD